jgi:hypothetical protein
MSMTDTNPRAVIGGNAPPDWAKQTTDRLADEYQGLTRALAELVVEVQNQPRQVESDEQALRAGALIKRLRDLRERLENTRAVEKEPHLRAGNAIDAFFNGLKKTIAAETPNERRTAPGYIDQLQARINEHQDRKAAVERARLEAERRERERLAEEARLEEQRRRQEAERLQQEAEQRRLEAERARNPARIEEKRAAAAETERAAAAAAGAVAAAETTADRAAQDAQEARIATLAKDSEIVRTRGQTPDTAGVTLTTARQPYAYVVDREQLDAAKLFPFFSDAEVEKALRAYAKNTGHRVPMAGAEIGFGRKGVTR